MKTIIITLSMFLLIGCEEVTYKNSASTGPNSSIGTPGPKGDAGLTGSQGQQGMQGLQGLPGIAGPKGNTGLTGAQGIPGLNGLNGTQGVAGPKGDKGDKGLTGDKGATGLTGPSGINGKDGVDGKDGNGFNSLTSFSRKTNLTNCDNSSGVLISSGLDENENDALEDTEVLNTSYICDGKCYNCSDDDDGCGSTKVYLCHKDCKGKSKTLKLPQSAVQAHLNHGDSLGKCK